MVIAEWVGMGGLLLTNIGMLIGVYKHFDGRISRVYERFDENKKLAEDKFVRKDLCAEMHTNSSSNMKGLEERMEKRFDKLEELVTAVLKK